MNKFIQNQRIAYKPFIKGIKNGLLYGDREFLGYIEKVNTEYCLGKYFTYHIILDDGFVIMRVDENSLMLYE